MLPFFNEINADLENGNVIEVSKKLNDNKNMYAGKDSLPALWGRYYECLGYGYRAEKVWKDALKEFPDSYVIHQRLIWYYQKNGLCEKALAHIDKMIKLNEHDATWYIQKGLIYYLMNDEDNAFRFLAYARQFMEGWPSSYYLGLIDIDRENYLSAKKLFSRVIEINPQYEAAYFYRGLCHYELGDTAMANEDWEKVSGKGYKATGGEFVVRCGEHNLTIDTANYTRYLKIKGKLGLETIDKLRNAYEFQIWAEDYEAATKTFSQIYSLDTNNLDNILSLARIHYVLFHTDSAMYFYRKALAKDPGHIGASYYMGWCYYRKEKLDSALKYISAVIVSVPEFSPNYLLKGNILRDQKKYNEALEAYEKAIEIDNQAANAFFARAQLYQEKLNYYAALDNYSKGIYRAPDFYHGYVLRAEMNLRLNKLARARKDIERSLELKPMNIYALAKKGDYLENKRKFREALEVYDQAIEHLDSENEDPIKIKWLELGIRKKKISSYVKLDMHEQIKNEAALIFREEGSPVIYRNTSYFYYDGDQYAYALKYADLYEAALDSTEIDPLFYLLRGMIKQKLGDQEGSCKDLKRGGSEAINAYNYYCR